MYKLVPTYLPATLLELNTFYALIAFVFIGFHSSFSLFSLNRSPLSITCYIQLIALSFSLMNLRILGTNKSLQTIILLLILFQNFINGSYTLFFSILIYLTVLDRSRYLHLKLNREISYA